MEQVYEALANLNRYAVDDAKPVVVQNLDFDRLVADLLLEVERKRDADPALGN